MGSNPSYTTLLGNKDVKHYTPKVVQAFYNVYRHSPLRGNFISEQDLLFGKWRI